VSESADEQEMGIAFLVLGALAGLVAGALIGLLLFALVLAKIAQRHPPASSTGPNVGR